MSVLNLGYAAGDGSSLGNDCESLDTAYGWTMRRMGFSYVLCLEDVFTHHIMAEVRPTDKGLGWNALLHVGGLYDSKQWFMSVGQATAWAVRQVQVRRRLGY